MYVLLGHSCGATITFQVLMDAAEWNVQEALDLNECCETKGRGLIE